MLQMDQINGRLNRFLAVMLGCVFTLVNHCQLLCSFEEPGAGRRAHSCCEHGTTPPQSRHGNPECCRSDYPTPEVRSRMVPTHGLSVLAPPPAVHLIALPSMGRRLLLVDRTLRMTGATFSDPNLRI
jgi:hypothetical protein